MSRSFLRLTNSSCFSLPTNIPEVTEHFHISCAVGPLPLSEGWHGVRHPGLAMAAHHLVAPLAIALSPFVELMTDCGTESVQGSSEKGCALLGLLMLVKVLGINSLLPYYCYPNGMDDGRCSNSAATAVVESFLL